jgi:hypothetical protein
VNDQRIAPNDNTDPFNLLLPFRSISASGDVQRRANPQHRHPQTVLVHGFPAADGAFQPVDINQFAARALRQNRLATWIDTAVSVAAYWRRKRPSLA